VESENPFPKVLAKINASTQNPVNVKLIPGPTAISSNLSVDRQIVFGLPGSSSAAKVQVLVSGTIVTIYLTGSSNPVWATTPQLGDILVIPSGSVIAGAGSANVGQYFVAGATNNSITLLLSIAGLSPSAPVDVGPVDFSATPSHDIYDISSTFAPAGSALLQFTGSGDELGQLSNSSATGYARILGNIEWQIEKFGPYMCYTSTVRGGTAVSSAIFGIPYSTDISTYNNGEGGWVNIQVAGFSPENQGLFQVIRTQSAATSNDQPFVQPHNIFFVYNPNGIEETIQQIDNTSTLITEVDSNTFFGTAQDYIDFYSFDSVIAGDSLSLSFTGNASLWNGQWSVSGHVPPSVTRITGGSSISGTPGFASVVITPSNTSTMLSSLTTVSGISTANVVSVNSPTPLTLYKEIIGIAPDPINLTTLADVIVDSCNLWDRINPNFGFTMSSLDKIDFSTDFTQGLDAYKIATGIISTANQVVYGVENNSLVYPGVAAAEANINIEAAVVKVISVSVGVRLSVPNTQQIIDNIQSAIASTINSSLVGQSISMSEILSAVQAVQGVTSAVVLSPQLSSTNDLIVVQPFEKPLVVDLNTDIQVTVI
jgi:hypothetical protein